MRHQDDEPAPCRDRRRSRAGRACGAPRRSSGMAHVEPARRAAKYHNHPAAAQMPRTEPCRERLAVAARQLAVKQSYNDILDHCCHAWNKLVDMPWKIMSIGLRHWAHRF